MWRSVPEFPKYEVSDDGQIRRAGHLLKPRVSFGYLRVNLCDGPRSRWCRMHRLVLEAFIGPCPDGCVACHQDGNRANNVLSNLRWDTQSANHYDATRHGTHPGLKRKGERHPLARFNEKIVSIMRHLAGRVPQSFIAEVWGTSQQTVQKIVTGERWKHSAV